MDEQYREQNNEAQTTFPQSVVPAMTPSRRLLFALILSGGAFSLPFIPCCYHREQLGVCTADRGSKIRGSVPSN